MSVFRCIGTWECFAQSSCITAVNSSAVFRLDSFTLAALQLGQGRAALDFAPIRSTTSLLIWTTHSSGKGKEPSLSFSSCYTNCIFFIKLSSSHLVALCVLRTWEAARSWMPVCCSSFKCAFFLWCWCSCQCVEEAHKVSVVSCACTHLLHPLFLPKSIKVS